MTKIKKEEKEPLLKKTIKKEAKREAKKRSKKTNNLQQRNKSLRRPLTHRKLFCGKGSTKLKL